MTRKFTNALLAELALSLITVVLLVSPEASLAQDAGRGGELFEKRCTGCHALDKEKEGPRLRSVYGRTAGSVPTFTYSDALKSSKITWDAASLDKWLADPEKVLPGNDMAFRVLKGDERADIIAYLKQLSEH